jgi:uncharacterized membrane protein
MGRQPLSPAPGDPRMRALVSYLATGLAFLLLDACFLTLVGPGLYRPALNAILGDGVRIVPAILFYAVYVAGLTRFCVAPAWGARWTKALWAGLFLGLVAYGTYDLTCQAVMRVWSWRITLVDLAWGACASAAAATLGALAASRIKARA